MLMALPGENGDVLHVTRFNYIDHAKEKYSRDSKSKYFIKFALSCLSRFQVNLRWNKF